MKPKVEQPIIGLRLCGAIYLSIEVIEKLSNQVVRIAGKVREK